MKPQDRYKKIIDHLNAYGSITSSDVQAMFDIHRNTASLDLRNMEKSGILTSSGTGKGAKYLLRSSLPFSSNLITPVFLLKEHRQLENYFKKRNRPKSFFNRTSDKALNADFSYSKEINLCFDEMKRTISEKRKTMAEQERIRKKEKLIIDLSWASSNIEGNTYSLLETETLIKYNQTAKGKSYLDAQMILNHKEAIGYIREAPDYKHLTKKNVLELHQCLTNNLGVDTGFRKRLVAISNSSFVPCDNQFQIISFFERMLDKINNTSSILEKAVAINLLVAYLQPFEDGNKRTSRMLGNAILMSHEYLPISFIKTPKEDYIKAMLYFYEKQNPSFFKKLFLEELNNSLREYIG